MDMACENQCLVRIFYRNVGSIFTRGDRIAGRCAPYAQRRFSTGGGLVRRLLPEIGVANWWPAATSPLRVPAGRNHLYLGTGPG